MKRIGIDIGSTTIKCAVLEADGDLIYSSYERHRSQIAPMLAELLRKVAVLCPSEPVRLAISGSAGMGIANDMELPFVQEVYATRLAVKERKPEINTVIELGGEDAKILFLSETLEVRMNGTCAGGTGAFIDQMAELMNLTPEEMGEMAGESEKLYTIASRCGVFAKSDIQPLLNQGAQKKDIAASIFYAVVNQTVAGLAQGREIAGNVLYLGGPLTFFPYMRHAFDDTLHITGTCPEHSLYYVAIGAAISPTATEQDLLALADRIENYQSASGFAGCRPLFSNREEYDAFLTRHEADSRGIREIDAPNGEMFLGIDAGSTTVKAVLCDREGNLLFPMYLPNSGNPIPLIRKYLTEVYAKYPDIQIAGSAVTGYGEAIIQNAFGVDRGVVETIAHYTAAAHFCPEVDFIIDIGGQDIKCFRIRGGAIDSIFLNEACSSGCGSFLQTFAGVLGYTPKEFAEEALFAKSPVDLGSRCTVFMNSSVKQAQKDGASIADISAGLSISVVKNALYKVIRCANPKALGNHIVVQGGTFLNNAVLRAFEQEIGKDVLRPSVAGLMGAYGAALYAMAHPTANGTSGLIDAEGLATFEHQVTATTCHGCSNRCRLTINRFSGGRRYIAGNRCEKPLRLEAAKERYDLYEYKYALLSEFRKNEQKHEGAPTVGIPMALNLYELLPFWYTLFDHLGYHVVVSGESNHVLYVKGQHTITSDTACYPAKLVHGHIEDLLERGVDILFYPGMSYNVDEGYGANHYNCPVVAYYPSVIAANVKMPERVTFVNGFISLHDRRAFAKHFVRIMGEKGIAVQKRAVERAAEAAYRAYDAHMEAVRQKGEEYLKIAKEKGMPAIVLAGRPYHIDPEINHGIDRLLCDLGAVVVTEDAVARKVEPFETTVLNQWTYHARLYAAAKFVAENTEQPMGLVQLVSFGCGVDAVTTDETRAILEARGKIYTQIKIDEITNLGAVKIRLRSLFAVMEEKK